METDNLLQGPPVPSIILANLNQSLSEFLTNIMKNHPRKVVLIDADNGERLFVNDVIERSFKLACLLQKLGYKPGHVIGVICENRSEYPVILMASLHIGAVAACFNPKYTADELKHTMSITMPSVIFSNGACVEKVKTLLGKSARVINLDGNSKDSYQALLKEGNAAGFIKPDISMEDTAVILFSSGSTGLPKGVMLTHKGFIFLLSSLRFFKGVLGQLNKEEIMLSVVPMFHGYGIMLIFTSLVLGQTLVNVKKFEEKKFLGAIEKYKVTSLRLVPPLMVFFAKHPSVGKYDLSSVAEVTCGAAPLSPNIEMTVKDKLKLPKIIQGYGMTETTVVCTTTMLCDKVGSCGRLLPGMLGKVIDLETSKALGPNAEGEICFKGPMIMKGYYNNREETAKAIDKDGWLHTGDVGYYDEDEDFFIVDRIKDLIKYKGFQVAPAELESLLLKHEGVKDAAVIGIPDEIAGEVPRAFVVKQPHYVGGEDELIDYVNGQVAPHMKLRGGVSFIGEIPKNANGKILRRDLRQRVKTKSKL